MPWEGAELRLSAVEETWANYKSAHSQILPVIKSERVDELIDSFDIAQTNYLDAATAFKAKINANKPKASLMDFDSDHIKVQCQLPESEQNIKNNWGYFHGDDMDWPGFRDRFHTAIHSKPFSAAFKFLSLKSSLKGRAAVDFGDWQLTNDGYEEAWERLNQMYDKKYAIRRAYLRRFFSLREIQGTATKEELKTLSSTTHNMVRQLRAQGLPVDHWDFILVHRLHELIGPDVGRRWELKRSSDEPKLTDLLAFIEQEADAAPATETTTRRLPSVIVRSNVKERIGRDSSANRAQGQKKSTDMTSKPKTFLCECHDFLACSLNVRWDIVRRRDLCPNCLKRGHKVENCFSRKCVRCPGAPAHNILLCPNWEGSKHIHAIGGIRDSDEMALVPPKQKKPKYPAKDNKMKLD